MKRLLALLAACALPAPEGPDAAGPETPAALGNGVHHAVVHLEAWDSENASNAGGWHYTFSIDGQPPDLLVHAGGHGYRGDCKALPCGWDAPRVDLYFVAEVSLGEPAMACPRTWCTSPQPSYAGVARHLVPAQDLAAARAMLAAIPRTGYPRGEISLAPW